MEEACELRMPFRKTAARRKRADPDCRFRLLRKSYHQIDGLRTIDGGADDEGGVLACRECRDQRVHRFQVRAEFPADVARFYRLCLMCSLVDPHRHEARSAG